jgi:hypothetical protein
MPDIRTLGSPILQTIRPLESILLGSYVADEPISALRVVRVSTAGHAVYARPPELAARGPLGVTMTAALSGGVLSVVLGGEITDSSWNWTPGAPVLLGSVGALTQVVSSDCIVGIGQALNATTILVRISPPIILAP